MPAVHPPPPTVTVHNNADGAPDVYYALYHGWRLTDDALDQLETALAAVAIKPPVLTPHAGFAFLPRQKVEEVHQQVYDIINEGMEPDPRDGVPQSEPGVMCGIVLTPFEQARIDNALLCDELFIPIDMPEASRERVTEAWRRWTTDYGRPCNIRMEEMPAGWSKGEQR